MALELVAVGDGAPNGHSVPADSAGEGAGFEDDVGVNVDEESRGLLRGEGTDVVQAAPDGGVFAALATMCLLFFIASVGAGLGVAHLLPTAPATGASTSMMDGESAMSMEDAARLSRKRLQVKNYVNGTALILNVHITHHAGTSVCRVMRRVGPAPSFACMDKGRAGEDDGIWPDEVRTEEGKNYRGGTSWSFNDTARFIKVFRPHYHFVSLEFRYNGKLQRTNWEHEDLVSMIIMRDPLERFLSGGRCGKYGPGKDVKLSGDPTNETMGLFWEYANSHCADNYALKVLAADGGTCVNGSRTGAACLEGAKDLVRRFTYVVDQACLAESMVAMGRELRLDITKEEFDNHLHHHHTGSVRERLNNDTLYEFLRRRFRRDIELYEWSKTQSIVQCDNSLRYY